LLVWSFCHKAKEKYQLIIVCIASASTAKQASSTRETTRRRRRLFTFMKQYQIDITFA